MNSKHLVAGLAGCSAVLSAHAAGNLFTGSIQYANIFGPVAATPDWDDPGTKLSWNISYVGGTHPWEYSYTWETEGKDLSHILIEVSGNTVLADFELTPGTVTLEGDSPKQHTEQQGNPGLPEPLFGLKFEVDDEQDVSWTFRSTRPPTWGDFYAKDGQVGGVDTIAYNFGFTAADTDPLVDFAAIALGDLSSLQHDGPDRSIHIAVPDTVPRTPRDFDNPVPEPGTLAAGLALGALAFGAFLRRRR